MGNPKPVAGWVKGQSGNPAGRPKLPDTTQRLKEIAKIEAIESLSKVMMMTTADLAKLAQDPKATSVMKLAASLLHKAIKQGCPNRANFIFQYIVGKPESLKDEDLDPALNLLRLAYAREDLDKK